MSSTVNTNERFLLLRWQKDVRLNQIAHLRASASCNRIGRLLGLLVTVFSAVVGTSIFASLNSSNSRAILVIVGLVSIAAAVLSGAYTFLNYGERSQKHETAGDKYGSIRRRIDESLAVMDPAQLKTEINDLRQLIDKLDEESPVVPQNFIDEARAYIESREKKSQSLSRDAGDKEAASG